MIPVNQQYKHQPGKGIFGDCYRACIASVLEKPIEDVPHFLIDDPSQEVYEERIQKFFKDNKIVRICIPYMTDPRVHMKNVNSNIYYILSGTSSDGIAHSVVCIDNGIVHDPAGDVGISGPMKHDDIQNVYWVEFFGLPVIWNENGL